MALSIHVNGPALVRIGSGGVGGTLTDLGYTEDGVDIEIEALIDPVIGDNGGFVPIDYQSMGKIARISGRFSVYDQAVIDTIHKMGAVAAPIEPAPGFLLGSNAAMFRVVIASPMEALPYRFMFCTMDQSMRTKRGSKRSIPEFHFVAIPGAGAGVMTGLALYDNING